METPMSSCSFSLLLALSLFLVALAPVHGQAASSFVARPVSHGQQQQQSVFPPEQRERAVVNTVSVKCYPGFMEITVKADLFAVGAPVAMSELRVGPQSSKLCSAVASKPDEYTITAGLSDCGTRHWMTHDSLIYTNLLVYSPAPSVDGVIRMEEAVVPVECHYMRKYSLSSSSLSPTWVPFTSTQAAVQTLEFDLKVMTTDWQYERGSKVFHLGEPISIEASVRTGHHMGLRVFLSSCVATLDSDRHSIPRYVFIENDGCLVDSQLQGSRSQFNPRIQDDKLQLVVDAFRFYQEDRGDLYITCLITASPVTHADSHNKACTFINGRWRSADGNDYLCGYCQNQSDGGLSQNVPGQSTDHAMPRAFIPRGHGQSRVPQSHFKSGMKTVWEQEAGVGPMLVLPNKHKLGPIPEEELPPLLTKMSRPTLYSSKWSQWRSGIDPTRKLGSDQTDSPVDSSKDGGSAQNDLHAERDLQKGNVFGHMPTDLEKGLVLDRADLPVTEASENATDSSDQEDLTAASDEEDQEDTSSGTDEEATEEVTSPNMTRDATPTSVPTTTTSESEETDTTDPPSDVSPPTPIQKGKRFKMQTTKSSHLTTTTSQPTSRPTTTSSHSRATDLIKDKSDPKKHFKGPKDPSRPSDLADKSDPKKRFKTA